METPAFQMQCQTASSSALLYNVLSYQQTGYITPYRFFPLNTLFLSRSPFRLLQPFSYELQQQLVGGIDDPPGEERTVVVEVGSSEEHSQTATPFSPHC